MKLIKMAAIGIMVVAALILGGCMLPGIVDPVDPVVAPVEPVLTLPVAAFSYYSGVDPIQTDSFIIFDGSDSYDPNGEIVWGEWEFGDEDEFGDVEGPWTVGGLWVWENGERQWVELPGVMGAMHIYAETGSYTVRLTVWDYDGNQDSTTRKIRVW